MAGVSPPNDAGRDDDGGGGSPAVVPFRPSSASQAGSARDSGVMPETGMLLLRVSHINEKVDLFC